MKLEREIDLPASPEEVYDVVMDPRRLHEWVTIHEDVKEAPPRVLEHGDVMLQRLKVAGKGLDVRWKVTTAERARRVVWTGDGPARSTAISEYRFTPVEAGTHFVYGLEFRPPGGILGGFASRAVLSTSVPQRELEGSLQRLKALLER